MGRNRTKPILALALAGAVLLGGGRARAAEAAARDAAAAVAELESYVPAVEGQVVSVAGDTVYTDIPLAAGLREGSELVVFREGEDFVHPLTGQVMGRRENGLGVLRVNQVRDQYAAGVLVAGRPEEIKAGDRVRITSNRVRVAVMLPPAVSGEDRGWQDLFLSALERSKRFIPADMGEAAEGDDLSEKVKAIAAARKADMAVFAGREAPAGRPSLRLRLFSGATGALVASALADIPPVPKAGGERSGESPEAPGGAALRPSQDLGRRIDGLCLGRLTGGPEDELAVTDGRGLFVYARSGDAFKELWKDGGQASWRILALDCGDIDGNGRDEVFVTRYAAGQGRMDSYVAEYQGGVFTLKEEAPGLLFRVVRSGGRPRLYAQEYDPVDPRRPPVREYDRSGGRYAPLGGESLGVPSVYGFGLADVDGDGRAEVTVLNAENYLEIYRPSGERMWTSGQRFGGSAVFLAGKTPGDETARGPAEDLEVKGRILAADLDGDGREELALFGNIPKPGQLAGRVRRFDRSTMGFYRWDGTGLAPLAPTEAFEGYTADAALSSGAEYLVIGLNVAAEAEGQGGGRILIRKPGMR